MIKTNDQQMMYIKKIFMLIGIMIPFGIVQAQDNPSSASLATATLSECYEWSRINYPLIAKLDLLEKSTQYSLSNASKGNLPQININGQATYQSEVTELPLELPNVEIPTQDKDQYKIYGEIYQPLTNFSTIKSQKEQIAINGQIEQQKIEIDLYQLKDRINQIYFGTLLMEVKNEQLLLVQMDIDSTIARLDAAINNGTATLMDRKLLEVEKINVIQQLNENQSNQEAFLQMLAALTGKNITTSTSLVRPVAVILNSTLNRPELRLFDLQEQFITIQKAQISNRHIPILGLFFQGGYGRPALNFLSNDFSAYYITGLKFNWNLSNFYTSKNDRQRFDIQGQLIDTQKEIFLLNTEITQSQHATAINKYNTLINSDKQAVQLREEIKSTAEVQLANGLITTIDYIKILNDASRAKQQLNLHEIMHLQSQYNLNTTIGN